MLPKGEQGGYHNSFLKHITDKERSGRQEGCELCKDKFIRREKTDKSQVKESGTLGKRCGIHNKLINLCG